jgi:hypothetical protein
MNNRAARNELKVDVLSMPLKENNVEYFIVIYNINIPIQIIENPTDCEQVLYRVRALLTTDFAGEQVSYQITASYALVHAITGQQRTWTGSFNARANAPAQLTPFEIFNSNTFVASALEGIDGAERKLSQTIRQESQWKFDHLISIIFNIQAKVQDHHPVIQRRRFPQHGRRAHITFPLP